MQNHKTNLEAEFRKAPIHGRRTPHNKTKILNKFVLVNNLSTTLESKQRINYKSESDIAYVQ